jgi:hypothetical protein
VILVIAASGGWYAAGLRDTGRDMARRAREFLDSLSEDQRGLAVLDFEDDRRVQWHFIPKSQRKGLQIRDMNDRQRELAHKLLRSALSQIGYDKAVTIMELEQILNVLEREQGRFRRDNLRYYFTVFGRPQEQGRWGLSIEGHHLSVNFVIEDGKVVSHTPAFFGANPALVKSDVDVGPKRGTRVLDQEEILAFQLLRSLSESQSEQAVIDKKAPRDIRAAGQPQPPETEPVGLAARQMDAKQRQVLLSLIKAYTDNMPRPVAAQEWAEIRAAGLDEIHFAWAGASREGVGHYYRIHGPTFLIELCNTQPDSAGNPANHVHTVYRSLAGDFAVERG